MTADRKRTSPLIDTHCHLDMREFDGDRDEVIMRATDSGIEALITVSSDLESASRAVELAQRYGPVYASVGVHPHDSREFSDGTYLTLKEMAKKPKVVAIGETGLDYHYDRSPRGVQAEVFRRHLQLAKESGLPVIVHSREAQEDTIRIMEESDVGSGVLHCFSGDMDMAEKAMSMGFFISIAGPVTFRKSSRLKEVAASIPDDYLLVETDSPYLSPEPVRGKRNEPSYVVHTASLIAELRDVSLADIARITTLNAKRLFGVGRIADGPRIAYRIRDSLYLNITNRCTNKCSFCVKFRSDFVKGHNLRLGREPSEEEIIAAIGDPSRYKEVVFCGYGEPLQRIDVVKKVARWIKGRGGRVRVNTNGHAGVIYKRDIAAELAGLVDSVSVSLDAHDEATYNRICKPSFDNAYPEVIRFIKSAKEHIPEVRVTVVELEGVDIDKCGEIARGLGVELRIRKLDVVG